MAQLKYSTEVVDRKLIKKESEKGKLIKFGLKAVDYILNKEGVKVKRKIPEAYRGAWTLNLDETAGHNFEKIYSTRHYGTKLHQAI